MNSACTEVDIDPTKNHFLVNYPEFSNVVSLQSRSAEEQGQKLMSEDGADATSTHSAGPSISNSNPNEDTAPQAANNTVGPTLNTAVNTASSDTTTNTTTTLSPSSTANEVGNGLCIHYFDSFWMQNFL